MKRFALFTGFELGAKFGDYSRIVGVPPTLFENKCMCVGLFEQVFDLVYLVRRVDRDKHRSYLRRCPECDVPFGQIRRPNGDLAAFFYTERNKRARKRVHIVAEFFVCSRIIKRRILERALVGKRINHRIKQFRKRAIDKFFFFPDKASRMRFVVIKVSFGARRVGKPSHKTCEVRKNYFGVRKFGQP